MRTIPAMAFLAAFAFAAFADEPRPETDSEIWNRGLGYWRDGDATNALAVLKPIMLSRTHGARAAEIVAKINYDMARKPGCDNPLKHLEEGAAAAQIALRANPDDRRARDNFARAAADVPSLRETERVNAVLKAAEKTDPADAVRSALAESRFIAVESLSYATNEAVRAIAAADSLSARMLKTADVFIPLKGVFAEASTNEEQNAALSSMLDNLRKRAEEASEFLSDMNPEARYAAAEVEDGLNLLHKMTVLPPEAIREDFVAQSNAWQDVAEEFSRPWQKEALDFTEAFIAKFPQWADMRIQQGQTSTNNPPFTAETKQQIEELAALLPPIQSRSIAQPLPPDQEEALEIIKKIIELMPDDNGGNKQNQDQKGDSGKDNSPPQDKDKNKGDDGQDGQSNPPQDGSGEENPEDQDGQDEDRSGEQEENAGEEDSGENEEDKLMAILKKAQERNDEHEERKKAIYDKSKLPANEKDW